MGEKPVEDHTIDELLNLYVRFHEEAEADPTLEDRGREAFRALEKGDVSLRAFWGGCGRGDQDFPDGRIREIAGFF